MLDAVSIAVENAGKGHSVAAGGVFADGLARHARHVDIACQPIILAQVRVLFRQGQQLLRRLDEDIALLIAVYKGINGALRGYLAIRSFRAVAHGLHRHIVIAALHDDLRKIIAGLRYVFICPYQRTAARHLPVQAHGIAGRLRHRRPGY